MRLSGWLTVGAGFAMALAAPASAQTVARRDLLGVWMAKEVVSYGEPPGYLTVGPFWLALWGDDLFHLSGGTNSHGSGRWRLNGDTLWLGNDWRYGNGAVNMRGGILQADTLDTLRMPAFPRNDSLFWTHSPEERRRLSEEQGGGGYWILSAYKIALKGGRLVLHRLDALSNSTAHPASAVMDAQPNTPVPW